MIVFNKKRDLAVYLESQKQISDSVGFVPTMGALHQGHISLIEQSKKENALTVCSIFVNPTQFNNPKDLEFYPRTPEKDVELLKQAGCDVLYMPDVDDVYSTKQKKQYTFGHLSEILEAAKRPGHFDGVGQVVSILLEIIKPNKAYFGSKDYQQVMVVKNLVSQMQLPIEIIPCPIIREYDGLAMSSRNVRLNTEQRALAANIPQWMKEANSLVKQNKISEAKQHIQRRVSEFSEMKLDYYEVCDADSLNTIHDLSRASKQIALIALFIGEVRLIDNLMVS